MAGKNRIIHVYDFFSGCGGTSAGLRAAGMKIVFALDNDYEAAKTFKANFPDTLFLEKDIEDLSIQSMKRLVRKSRQNPILFSACAPCQPFSNQNRQKRRNDIREPLLVKFVRFVDAIKPDYIFLENVPALGRKLKAARGQFSEVRKVLESNGYSYDQGVVSAPRLWNASSPEASYFASEPSWKN